MQQTDIKKSHKKRKIGKRKKQTERMKEVTEQRKTDYQIMGINGQTEERINTKMKAEKSQKRENMKKGW